MDTGGGPDRDDFGLPRVDVQIPDDARELDREVQAYHRELRALRRRMLAQRLLAPLARHGLVMPLIAICLALTLLAGTMLTLFTAGQGAWVTASVPRPGRTPAGPGRAAASPGSQARNERPLPSADVLLGGAETPLTSLTAVVLAVVPAGCRCQAGLRQLAAQATAAHADLVLVGMNGTPVTSLALQAGLPPAHVAEDTSNVLARYYHLTGLAAILVRPDGLVAAVVLAQGGRFQLGSRLWSVLSGAPQG